MEDDVIILQRLFTKYTALVFTEEETATEKTWFIASDEKKPVQFNYIPREFTIVVNLTDRKVYNKKINNAFISKLMLEGINLISSTFNDSNRYGELTLSSFRKFNCLGA